VGWVATGVIEHDVLQGVLGGGDLTRRHRRSGRSRWRSPRARGALVVLEFLAGGVPADSKIQSRCRTSM
jgi:hypothetical protein